MDFTAALIVLATVAIGCGVSQDSSPASTVISSPETSAPSLTASTVTSSPSIASSLTSPPTTSSPVTPPRVTTTWSQVTSSTQRNSLTFMTSKGVPSGSDVTTSGELYVANVLSVPGGDLTTALPVWIKCTTDVQLEDLGNDNIVKVLSAWCENYQKIIDCMSRDIVTSAPDNPLDFFLNLTFNNNTLRIKSENVCAKFKEKKDKLSCADTANETLAGACSAEFSGGIMHVYMLYKEQDLPKDVFREVACDVTIQTTLCMRDILWECDDDVQSVLLSYYSLFTNDTCVAKERMIVQFMFAPPDMCRYIYFVYDNTWTYFLSQATQTRNCCIQVFQEAVQTLSHELGESQPASLLDFLILGLKTDCETYLARYACYKRELFNITNFRDFWLSLTFDHDNAIASQKAYCEHADQYLIPRITTECFNKSQPGLAACEAEYGRQVEEIREEWYKNPDFDGLQLQTLACRTSVNRAACLDNAMQPCGLEVSRAMAVNEIGILPDICRRLLTLNKSGSTFPIDLGNSSESDEVNRTGNTNTFDPNGTDRNQVYPANLWPILDQTTPGISPETSTDSTLTKESMDSPVVRNESTDSKATNGTTQKGIKGGKMRKQQRVSTVSTSSSKTISPVNGSTIGLAITVTILLKISRGVVIF